MSLNPPIQDIRNFQYPDGSVPPWLKSEEIKDKSGSPAIYGNDVDSVDVATRYIAYVLLQLFTFFDLWQSLSYLLLISNFIEAVGFFLIKTVPYKADSSRQALIA